MSRADAERFVMEARKNPQIDADLRRVVGVKAVVEVARRHGASFSEADMREYLFGTDRELSEEELGNVSGGVTGLQLRWGLNDQFP